MKEKVWAMSGQLEHLSNNMNCVELDAGKLDRARTSEDYGFNCDTDAGNIPSLPSSEKSSHGDASCRYQRSIEFAESCLVLVLVNVKNNRSLLAVTGVPWEEKMSSMGRKQDFHGKKR